MHLHCAKAAFHFSQPCVYLLCSLQTRSLNFLYEDVHVRYLRVVFQYIVKSMHKVNNSVIILSLCPHPLSVDENGKDQGVNVRQKVKEMVEFVQDDDRLREERKKAKKNKDKYIGVSSDSMGYRSYCKFSV